MEGLPSKYRALELDPHHCTEDVVVCACNPHTLEVEAGESGVSFHFFPEFPVEKESKLDGLGALVCCSFISFKF